MAKINLLSEGRRPVVARRSREPSFTAGDQDRLGRMWLFGLVILGLLVTAGYWFYLHQTIGGLDEEIAVAQEELDELAPIIREVEEFKAKKADLERKIGVINELKANQKGPVRIMDQVSQALPELLWLTQMQVQGNRVQIRGQAFNTNAVANFIENLDQVPEFQEPTLRETAQRGRENVYEFNLEFNFVRPEEAAAAADEGAEGETGTDAAGAAAEQEGVTEDGD